MSTDHTGVEVQTAIASAARQLGTKGRVDLGHPAGVTIEAFAVVVTEKLRSPDPRPGKAQAPRRPAKVEPGEEKGQPPKPKRRTRGGSHDLG